MTPKKRPNEPGTQFLYDMAERMGLGYGVATRAVSFFRDCQYSGEPVYERLNSSESRMPNIGPRTMRLLDAAMEHATTEDLQNFFVARGVDRDTAVRLSRRPPAALDLLGAAKAALAVAESWIHSELDGTSLLAEALAELQPVRDTIKEADARILAHRRPSLSSDTPDNALHSPVAPGSE